MSGHVELDKNGDRQLDYTISMVQLGQYVPLYDYNYADKQLVSLGDKLSTTDVLWPGMQNWKPTDTPICGWNNQFCIEVTRKTFVSIHVFVEYFIRRLKKISVVQCTVMNSCHNPVPCKKC